MNSQNKKVNAGNQAVSYREQAAYVASNIGTAFSWGYITSYFMMFCTDAVGISVFTFSVLLLLSRLFDGVTDTLFGYIADRTATKWGRYRPWIALSAIPVALSTSFLFYADADWSIEVKLVKICASYLLFLLIFTIFSTPLDAMSSVISGNPKERAKIISMKSAAGIIGAMLMAQIAGKFFDVHGTNTVAPYFQISILFALISIPLYMLTPLMCKERILPKEKAQKHVHMMDNIKKNLKSKPFRIALMGHFLNGLITYWRVAVFVYYFKYVVDNMALYAVFIMLMRVPQIFGTYVAQYVLQLFKKPGKALSCLYIAYGATLALNFFILPKGIGAILFWALTIVSSFLFGITYSLIYTIIPDLADYNEYQNHSRNDGGIFALLEFGNKVGMAIGTSGMGFILAMLGFTANTVQTPLVLTGINAMMFTVPGIISIIIGLLFTGYKLDRTVLRANQ